MATEIINIHRKRPSYFTEKEVQKAFDASEFNYLKKLFNSKHLNHIPKVTFYKVNPKYKYMNPVIIGRYIKNEVEYDFILEGNHRIARALRDNLCLEFYQLTIKETNECFSKRPPKGKKFIL
jgi:hypothetical protein